MVTTELNLRNRIEFTTSVRGIKVRPSTIARSRSGWSVIIPSTPEASCAHVRSGRSDPCDNLQSCVVRFLCNFGVAIEKCGQSCRAFHQQQHTAASACDLNPPAGPS